MAARRISTKDLVIGGGLAVCGGAAGSAFLVPAGAGRTSGASVTSSVAAKLSPTATSSVTPGPNMAVLGTVAACAGAVSLARVSKKAPADATVVPMRAFESELGVQAPVGFFDPLGFTADGDVAAFKRRRSVEIKHGRISMMAAMGYITPEITGKFPGYLSPSAGLKFADVPNGLAAISKVPSLGWVQIVLYFGFAEFSGGFDDYKTGTPGDYGFKVLTSSDPAERTKKLSAEIANGRLAMMAIIGMFFQDGLTGSAWGDWALYTDSPLRAAPDFSKELGACAPLGFWDPLGLSKYDNPELAVATFKRRRIIEIQHGRVAMFACIGYIVPEYYKWPGFCSPSEGISFEDIPNGFGALSKVPGTGWVQIVGFIGIIDISNLTSDTKEYAGDFNGYGAFGIPFAGGIADKESKERKLLAEINNGRLAMMAIIGMFFQNGLTGQAWGDWSLYTDSPLRAFENELGVQPPIGFWDPAALSSDGDVQTFKRRRVSEIKHGRIAMLATMGYITPELFGKFPGMLSPSKGLSYADIPNGLGAISKVPLAGWFQIFLYCLYVEASSLGFGYFDKKVQEEPGNYGWKPPFLASADPAVRTKKLQSELANGRLAMMAIIGMFFQDGLTGSAWGDWANFNDSPLRAFESELGVQAPVGFFDPLGFTADGDVAAFKRRRSVEIKHGRISMMAAMGYITPEVAGKFPGYLSPSAGLKFADVPNGLAAISKVPSLGWVQIVLYFGFVEFSGGFDDYKTGTPGDYGFKVLTSNNPEERTKKLSAEIANGRLAMMAIIGMFFQDGLTGSAWGDWALYTDSPLRAFESELGVQAPVGFFDPLGLSKDGDQVVFRRRREAEIKHGRIAMLATMGYITPEFVKFPGYLSTSADIQFDQIPNGLAAISKIPDEGLQQILAYAFICECRSLPEDYSGKRVPGDKGWKPPFLATENAELKTKRLNAELANGRLAMMAIIGMFFQDGLTGSAWGDWALYTDSPLR